MANQEKPVRIRKSTSAGAAIGKSTARKAAPRAASKAPPPKSAKPAERKGAAKKVGATRSDVARRAPAKRASAKKTAGKRTVPPQDMTTTGREQGLPSRRAVSRSRAVAADEKSYLALRDAIVTALDGLKAKDVVSLDVRGRTSMTDLIVIASGTSTRHLKSLADDVVKVSKASGQPVLGVEGDRDSDWVLVDLGDAIVHLMLPRSREFYGLERLWSVQGDDQPDIEAVSAPD